MGNANADEGVPEAVDADEAVSGAIGVPCADVAGAESNAELLSRDLAGVCGCCVITGSAAWSSGVCASATFTLAAEATSSGGTRL